MFQGKTKSKAPELWNSINRRGDRAREVEDSSTAFHPLVGDSSAVSRIHISAHSGPTNSFEGSTEHSSGVGQDHAPDQDGISEDLSHVGPTNRELTSSRKSRRNDVVFPADQTNINNIQGSGVDNGHNQDASDEDGDDSSGVEEPRGIDAEHGSTGELPSVYDNIEGYSGIGTTVDSDKNNRDSLGKSQTPESYDEDEYSTSDKEVIGSDEKEDSYDLYPDDDNVSSGSDTEWQMEDIV